MRKEELAVILENHLHWLHEDINGWESMSANLTGAYLTEADLTRACLREACLTEADLTRADLTGADLRGAYLRGAYLTGADLTRADLRGAYLTGAYLRGADLTEADLTRACLRGADLREANLRGAYLTEADLTRACLREADLTRADLRGADLRGADLRGADLRGADLRGAKINYPIACPEEGQFIAWKKAVIPNAYSKMKLDMVSVIIKLLIPEEAKRSSATDRKCRASKAIVLEGYVLKDPTRKLSGDDVICSMYNNGYTYKIGDTLDVPDFDENRWNECAPGIHFFITRQEAEEYI